MLDQNKAKTPKQRPMNGRKGQAKKWKVVTTLVQSISMRGKLLVQDASAMFTAKGDSVRNKKLHLSKPDTSPQIEGTNTERVYTSSWLFESLQYFTEVLCSLSPLSDTPGIASFEPTRSSHHSVLPSFRASSSLS